jgi:transposase InsO family protein
MGYMSYTTNPRMPHVRMQAVRLVNQGWSTRKVARHLGYSQSSIVKWVAKSKQLSSNARIIPTLSSRPLSHPHKLSLRVVNAILDHRQSFGRCAEIIHYDLVKQGYSVSLSSVKRTLQRHNLTYPSKWKKWHQYPPRPIAEKPGMLVQIDTMIDGPHTDSRYAYAVIDTYSRWAFARAANRANTHVSWQVVKKAQELAPFPFQTIQSDHGSEFSKWFTKRLLSKGIHHRHSRVRRPTDNAHVERFIRTLQNECLSRCGRSYSTWRKAIPEFIHYYNSERPHMGLDFKTPLEVITSY